eukprot:m.66428 g.66428  ORF g.66428 m.66428 type:complete len:441 (-) comp11805_c0_seq2:144-1466(-)
MITKKGASVTLLLFCVVANTSAERVISKRPPMGWNTWCTEGSCGRDTCQEDEVKNVARAMKEQGLHDMGFEYLNLDDCWCNPTRDKNGQLYADPSRFPSGLPSLIQWLHEFGFKFGLYIDAGNTTCSTGLRNVTSIIGSLGFYETDAKTFANWGVDYVKMDWCSTEDYCKDHPNCNEELITKMSTALRSSGRDMHFQCPCTGEDAAKPVGPFAYCQEHCNSWRFFDDHHDTWNDTSWGTACIAQRLATAASFGKPSGWNDPDFLMTGGQGCPDLEVGKHCPGQTDVEYVTEMSLWAIAGAPLLVATDIRNLTAIQRKVLLNKHVIEINQQAVQAGGRVGFDESCVSIPRQCGFTNELHYSHTCEIWARGPFEDGKTYGVVLYNNADKMKQNITFSPKVIQFPNEYKIIDAWEDGAERNMRGNFTVEVEPRGVKMYQVIPS